MKTAHAKFQKGFSFLKKSQTGFTLIELLVVIGILAVLLAITLIAINPAKQFEQANNTQRSSDVNAILNAVWQYAVDKKGDLTTLNIPATATNISSTAGDVNLCSDVAPTYIAQIPVDPQYGSWTDCTNYDSQYSILKNAAGRITVSAPHTEPAGSPAISVTR